MEEVFTTFDNTIELIGQKPFYFFDFDRVQVTPQYPPKAEDFQSLSLAERQNLLEKLINRVKAL